MNANYYVQANANCDSLRAALLETKSHEDADELAKSFQDAAKFLIKTRLRSIAQRRGRKIGRPRKEVA